MLASLGFRFYVGHVGSFGQLYGSVSSVIVALLWFYLTALTVLTGAEIHALRRTPGERRGRSRETGQR